MTTIDDRWIREGQSARRALPGGVILGSKAGAISDSDLDSEGVDNVLGGIDTTNKRLYIKMGGVWQYIQATYRPRARLASAVALRLDTGVQIPVPFDTETYDRGGFFDNTAAAIAGTVQKTTGSPAIVGTGTALTTDLAVNDTVKVSGGVDDISQVLSITDNTHCTLTSNMGSNNSGQTLTKTKCRVVIPEDGFYTIVANLQYAANTTGNRDCLIKRGTTSNPYGGVRLPAGATSSVMILQAVYEDEFVAGDYVQLIAQQTSGTQIQISQQVGSPILTISKKDKAI